MLIGEYTGKLADKNRIALPKTFREEMKGNLFITRGYETCLIILDETRWVKLFESIATKPLLNQSVRDTKRYLAGGAYAINLDSQGRFLISDPLINFATINKDVTFLGVLDWLEVWASEVWLKKLEHLASSASEIANRLEDRT